MGTWILSLDCSLSFRFVLHPVVPPIAVDGARLPPHRFQKIGIAELVDLHSQWITLRFGGFIPAGDASNIPLWTGGGTNQQIDLGQKSSLICVAQEQFDSKSIVGSNLTKTLICSLSPSPLHAAVCTTEIGRLALKYDELQSMDAWSPPSRSIPSSPTQNGWRTSSPIAMATSRSNSRSLAIPTGPSVPPTG